MRQRIWRESAGLMKAQHVRTFLWGLAELQEQLGAKLPPSLPTLCADAASWAGSCWGQLQALDVTDLCYGLAHLGHRPGSAWIEGAVEQ